LNTRIGISQESFIFRNSREKLPGITQICEAFKVFGRILGGTEKLENKMSQTRYKG